MKNKLNWLDNCKDMCIALSSRISSRTSKCINDHNIENIETIKNY